MGDFDLLPNTNCAFPAFFNGKVVRASQSAVNRAAWMKITLISPERLHHAHLTCSSRSWSGNEPQIVFPLKFAEICLRKWPISRLFIHNQLYLTRTTHRSTAWSPSRVPLIWFGQVRSIFENPKCFLFYSVIRQRYIHSRRLLPLDT